jgi:hypothetical protein
VRPVLYSIYVLVVMSGLAFAFVVGGFLTHPEHARLELSVPMIAMPDFVQPPLVLDEVVAEDLPPIVVEQGDVAIPRPRPPRVTHVVSPRQRFFGRQRAVVVIPLVRVCGG